MLIKFSPRIPSSYRLQSINQKKPVFTLLFVLTLFSIAMVTLPVRDTFFPYPLWKDVSFYQIIKMYLSARPSQMNRAWVCRNMTEAGMTKKDLDLSRIQFYDDVEEKLRQLSEQEQWKTGFAPALSHDDKISLLHVYAVFKHALDTARLGHILLHGSAIGAWRHQGITPWDDDIDIGINVDDWMGVKRALSCISGFTLDASTNSKWSFFKKFQFHDFCAKSCTKNILIPTIAPATTPTTKMVDIKEPSKCHALLLVISTKCNSVHSEILKMWCSQKRIYSDLISLL